MKYNPANWYWSGTPGIYSSAAGAIVLSTNTAYVAWLAGANSPTSWPKDETGAVTIAALDDVLIAAGLPPTGLTPPTNAQLQTYANGKLVALFAIARIYSLGSSISVKCDTTTSTGADLAALNAWGASAPTATTQWVDDFGAVTQITGAEAVALVAGVIAYGQSVYVILASAMTGIGSGSITTTAQIDALVWPT